MLGLRFKEERERLGFTQPVFAEIAGVKKRALIDWEKSVSSPTGTQLEALSKVGLDVLYVVTGQRAQATLPSEVVDVVQRYLKAPIEVKAAVLGALMGWDKSANGQITDNGGSSSVRVSGNNNTVVGRNIIKK